MIDSEWLMICYLLFFTDYSQWCICHVRNCGGFRSKNPLRTIEWERRSTGAERSAKLSRAVEPLSLVVILTSRRQKPPDIISDLSVR